MSKYRIAFLVWLTLMMSVAASAMVLNKYHPEWVCNDCVKWVDDRSGADHRGARRP